MSRKAEGAPAPVSFASAAGTRAGAAPVAVASAEGKRQLALAGAAPRNPSPRRSATGSRFESAPFQSPAASSPARSARDDSAGQMPPLRLQQPSPGLVSPPHPASPPQHERLPRGRAARRTCLPAPPHQVADSCTPRTISNPLLHSCLSRTVITSVKIFKLEYVLFKHLHERQADRFCDRTQREGMKACVLHAER